MSRAAAAAWWTVLGASFLAIGVGFAGGRSIGRLVLAPPPPALPRAVAPPVAERVPDQPRLLTGARSFDDAAVEPDAYGDPERSVAARPGGASRRFDPLRDRARIAVIVVDADRSQSATLAFAREPFPLAVALAPGTDADSAARIRAGGKTILIACDGATAAEVAAARRAGAAGIVCSTSEAARARALLAAAAGGIVVDDLLQGDALLIAARAAHAPAVTRDVVADARDDPFTVDFLLAQALAIAQRTGTATVAVHARPASLRAVELFARRAERDGIDLVDVSGIAMAEAEWARSRLRQATASSPRVR